MSTEYKDEEAIFKAAFKLESPAEQAAYLKGACGEDTDLLARVEALLKAHDEAGSFLEVPGIAQNATLDSPPSIDGPGTKIGRYELLELIGEGGMGLVYLAQQKEPVKRRVALKIVKPGMDSKQVIARFEAERQALALLDHPNIAHVFDAGTTKAGLPYFVMEYVKGMSITTYCDEHKLNIEQRLRLFEHVCEGIHHAHQKGIIHRDIKPSNILVSVHGDRVVPKIIDFGIAKAITQPLTEKTFVTFQGQLLGTLEYMSPEQVDLATQDIDIRSDIYSLGVVLYELLAGVLPFERESLTSLGFAEVQRTIREQEPASPSIRLTSLGEKAKIIAANRDTHVVALARRLHRELEWIPLKAMRKDRCRRYRSASEMADDIRNYLEGLPLIAGPETAVYRMQKFVHKHAGSVVTVALVTVAIVLGFIVSTAMYFRAEQARKNELVARTRAEQAESIAQQQRKLAEQRAEDYRRSLYVSRIALADVACRNNNIRRLCELLDSCPEDLRGWEWYRLYHISDQAIITLKGHAEQVFQAEVSPDGKRIVSGCNDGTIKVWDVATSTELMTLRGHDGGVNAVSFSPDGKRIVSGGGDNIIKVWDAATGEELMTVGAHDGWIWSVAFSADSKYIVSSSSDKTIKIWEASSGLELKTLRGHEGRVLSVTFSPNSKLIVSSSGDKTVKVWDAASGSELITLRGHHDAVAGVAVSPDGKRIASGSSDKTIKVWDTATGAELMTLRGHTDRVGPVSFSPDGSKIISGSVDNTIKVWDVLTGVEIRSLRGHSDWIWSVGFSPDGRRVISSGWDKTIKLWEWAIEHDRIRLGRSHSVAFSPDGKRIATTDWNAIRVWDTVTGTEVMNLRGHNHVITSVVFAPDSKCIISSSWDRTIKVWDTTTGSEQITINCDKCVNYASISSNGRWIVSACWNGTISIWDRNTGDELMTIDAHRDNVRYVEFSPDDKRIVSSGKDRTIKVWDAETGDELITFSGQKLGVGHTTFSPDGRHIMAGCDNGTIMVWDASTGDEVMTLRGHTHGVHSAIYSHDGKRIISGSNDQTVKVWDVTTRTQLMTLTGHTSWISSVAISPDDKTIATGDARGNVILWESSMPVNSHGPRRNGTVAQEVVDKLYERHGLYAEVIDKLKADSALDEPVRTLALKIANARRWQDAEKRKKDSWEVVSSPDWDVRAYQAALEKAREAKRIEPNDPSILAPLCLPRYFGAGAHDGRPSPSILTILGIAEYRTGSYEEALETLTHVEKIRKDNQLESDPACMAFIVMALNKLERPEEAEASLYNLRQLCKDGQFAEDKKAQNFLAEAEQLITGEKK